MLTNTKVKKLFKKYNISASKRLGQNFLVDDNIIDNIIQVASIKNKDIIEIGPGLGALTNALLKNAKFVTAYEIDESMCAVLDGEIEHDNFLLIRENFLKSKMDWTTKKDVVANIPYYITSDILFKLFQNANKIGKVTLMIQNEVADRLIAPIGTKTYGKLTLTMQLYVENIVKEFLVEPNSFMPQPKVNSAVITFNMKVPRLDHKNISLFIKKSFTQRRKTLFNNFKIFMTLEKAKMLIENSNFLNEKTRPQELSLEQFIKLYELTL